MDQSRIPGARCAMLLFAMTAMMPLAAAAADTPVIKLTAINSSETDVPTYILGHVLRKAGYEVEFVSADYTAGLTGLQQGDLPSPHVVSGFRTDVQGENRAWVKLWSR